MKVNLSIIKGSFLHQHTTKWFDVGRCPTRVDFVQQKYFRVIFNTSSVASGAISRSISQLRHVDGISGCVKSTDQKNRSSFLLHALWREKIHGHKNIPLLFFQSGLKLLCSNALKALIIE